MSDGVLSAAKFIGARSEAENELRLCRAAADDLRARIARAKEVVCNSTKARNYFDFTAGHAETAIERVHAGGLAEEWERLLDRDRARVMRLQTKLEALK